jgi:signal peptidase I
MKKSYIKVLILEITILILSIAFFLFFSKTLIINKYLIIAWSLVILFFQILVGIESDRSQNKIDTLQIVFAYTFVYYIFIYLLGLYVGFTRTPYNLSFISIMKNIIPLIIIIILQEIFRFNTIVKCKDNKLIMQLLIILFIVYEVAINFNHYSLNTGLDVFEIIGVLILPSIVNNLVITFMSYKSGYFPTILYRVLMTCIIYCVPIYPNLNVYLESVLGVIFPTILFLKFNTIFATNTFSKVKRQSMTRKLIDITLVVMTVFIIALVSGSFKYKAMAIGSNSMHPVFNKGDVVIITKISSNDEITKGKIVAYHHDNKVIVHRIYKIENKNNKVLITTKGDNNDAPDGWTFDDSDIIGIVNNEIPYVGWPSVWLTEIFK